MILKRLALVGLLAGVGVGTAACTDGYGYSGLNVGYGAPGYDYYGGGYGDPYYDGYGYGGYSSYFGWYGDFYYPGTGIYVYDRYRRPYRWNNDQQRYWQGRRGSYRGDRGGFQNNWNGFARPNGAAPYRGAQQGYRGQPYATGEGYRDRAGADGQFYRGQPNAGRPFYRGGATGTPGGDGYARRGYQGNQGYRSAQPDAVGQGQGEARSLGGRVAPSSNGAPAAAPRSGRGGGGWHGGGHRGNR